ncbi:MAG TPA: hypothetical protein PKL49_00850 [Steroidobacteraceae bacterium]|nr:hypothetical protein [Steroidobacteraceae bacterium]HNS28166.1 hypothetical protein [Steroidobacteraceae bacterium]
MKLPILAAALVIAFAGGPVYAACTYPTSPDKIPDGRVASMEEMIAAKKQVEQYNKDMEAYLSCIKLEFDAQSADSTLTAEQKTELEKRQVQKHNAAIDELEGVAARFNEQVKAYKAAHP